MKSLKITASALLLAGSLALAGCSGLETAKNELDKALATTTATSAPATTASTPSTTTEGTVATGGIFQEATELNVDPLKRTGDYYQVLGTSQISDSCLNSTGFTYAGLTNSVGQVGTACGLIEVKDFEKNLKTDKQKIKVDSAGYQGKKLTYYNGKIDKKGNLSTTTNWVYNRSHLIADSLGGNPNLENLITGTTGQNVGNNKGGMQYIEMKVYNFMKDQVDGKRPACPVNYEVTPHYMNASDKLPRLVEVNAKSCDGTINERVVTFNDQAGLEINYSTGDVKSLIK